MLKKLLVAIDGSADAMRAVSYVGDIVGTRSDFDITLFHFLGYPPNLLQAKDAGAELRAERETWLEEHQIKAEKALFYPARQLLLERGVREGVTAIHDELDLGPEPDPATAILRRVKAGDYSTVVVGRRGISRLAELVHGSVTRSVMTELQGCALWVVE